MSSTDHVPSFSSSSAATASLETGRPSFGTVSTASSHSNNDTSTEDEENLMPWEVDDYWIPRQKSGKQKSPNMIRNELQRYIDKCKANGTSTQTAILEDMGVNNNSFRRFMDPKTYKNQWSARQNSTYWAAAKLLERIKIEKERSKKASKKASSGKRKASDALGSSATSSTSKVNKTTSKASAKSEVLDLMRRVNEVEGVSYENGVFDTCPQVITKIKAFLSRDGLTKADFLRHGLGGVNSGSMNTFLASKKQDKCGNVTYKRAYEFFERLRILEGKPKSQARLKNEVEQPNGFSTNPQLGRPSCVLVSTLW